MKIWTPMFKTYHEFQEEGRIVTEHGALICVEPIAPLQVAHLESGRGSIASCVLGQASPGWPRAAVRPGCQAHSCITKKMLPTEEFRLCSAGSHATPNTRTWTTLVSIILFIYYTQVFSSIISAFQSHHEWDVFVHPFPFCPSKRYILTQFERRL